MEGRNEERDVNGDDGVYLEMTCGKCNRVFEVALESLRSRVLCLIYPVHLLSEGTVASSMSSFARAQWRFCAVLSTNLECILTNSYYVLLKGSVRWLMSPQTLLQGSKFVSSGLEQSHNLQLIRGQRTSWLLV